MVYFTNKICHLKEISHGTPYTNNVGYLHRSCTPWNKRNATEMTELVVSQESLSQGGTLFV